MIPDSHFIAQHLMNVIATICLISLANYNMGLCVALFPFHLLNGYLLWRGNRAIRANK